MKAKPQKLGLFPFPINIPYMWNVLLVPAQSQAQQKFFALVRGIQTGKIKIDDLPEGVREKVKAAAKSMTKQDVKDFASTPSKNLPKQVGESSYSVGSYLTFVRVLKESLTEVEIRLMCGEVLLEGTKMETLLDEFIQAADTFYKQYLFYQRNKTSFHGGERRSLDKPICIQQGDELVCRHPITGNRIPAPQEYKESQVFEDVFNEGFWDTIKGKITPASQKTPEPPKSRISTLEELKVLRQQMVEAGSKIAPYMRVQSHRDFIEAYINKHSSRASLAIQVLVRIANGEEITIREKQTFASFHSEG